MSNQKPTVWITNRLDIADNIYCIHLSFPEIIEYPEYEDLNRKERANNLTEEERSKLEYTRNDYINIIMKYGDFKKIDLLPDSIWSVLLDPVIAKGKVMNVPNPEDSIFAVRDGYILVTKPCAEILQRFRLSDTQMIPLQLFNPKTRELVNEETYYLLNIYAWRTYFDRKNNEIFVNENYKKTAITFMLHHIILKTETVCYAVAHYNATWIYGMIHQLEILSFFHRHYGMPCIKPRC